MNGTIIGLVKPANEPVEMWNSWCDGLYGAMDLLGKEKNLVIYVFGYSDKPTTIERPNMTIFLRHDIKQLKYALSIHKPTIIFGWGTSFHDWAEIEDSTAKKILLFAGGPYDYENASRKFDHIVVENAWDQNKFPNSTVAFGTNTEVFKPIEGYNKTIPSLYPASFAKWKRHSLWAESMPTGSLAVGQYQDHEKECYEVCREFGHTTIPQVPMTLLPHFYNQSLGVCVTSEWFGGCQRAVLESMACNVPVLSTNDNKCGEFDGVWTVDPSAEELRQAFTQMVTTFVTSKFDLRSEFIVGKYDHYTYAKKLKEFI